MLTVKNEYSVHISQKPVRVLNVCLKFSVDPGLLDDTEHLLQVKGC